MGSASDQTCFFFLHCPKVTQLRTLTSFWVSHLSEVYATSDTISPIRSTIVRSSHIFRHKLAYSIRPCPKFTHLRTQSCFFDPPLSEVHTASDTNSPIRFDLVRSLHIFGHNLAFSIRPCPKFSQLRTLTRLFDWTLSEVHTSSDTTWLFRLDLVRSSRSFRHNLAFSTRPCLKFTQLRTPTYFFHLPLSEVHTASDTNLLFLLALVRSSHYFGHTLIFSTRPCPKFTHLRTQSCFFNSTLSEVHTTSDTILLFYFVLV